jgi:Kef-type K+ transport system membrane component KefB
MPSLTNLLIVSVVAFAAPFVLGLFPSVRLPSVVLEIVAGIVVGPSVSASSRTTRPSRSWPCSA